MRKRVDIAIIGGGASGLAAAVSAARAGCGVLLLEAQQRVGRKLLSTGNGRCNITNTAALPPAYRSDCAAMVERVFAAVPPAEVMAFLVSTGVDCFEEREGRVYPRSEQASAVLDMLRLAAEHCGVVTVCDTRVESIAKRDDTFVILSTSGEYHAQRVVVACGSPAAPQLGGCADGQRLLKSLGHTINPATPALTQMMVDSPHTRGLKGVRLRCAVTLMKNGQPVFTDSGELQINEGALSGIVIFQISSRLARVDSHNTSLSVDLLPECPPDSLLTRLTERRKGLGYLPCEQLLAGLINKRAACCVMKDVGITPLTRPSCEISDDQLERLVQTIKRWSFPVTGLAGWKQAQVGSGGASLRQFTPELESTVVPGLYACGEVLDCDGDCGGFNLHWAWCSGLLAGRSAANKSKETNDDKTG